MSQVSSNFKAVATGCALLAVLAAGCSKQNGAAFDPDSGHPANYIAAHPNEYLSGSACGDCHGGDLQGGISKVSCFSASRDGQSCHADGPGGHPAGWLAVHSATDPAQAVTCAACHKNKANNLPPDCFNNSICHGPKSNHPSNWLSTHPGTNPNQASSCAKCHQSRPGTPRCFNNTLCHGQKSPHPSNWQSIHSDTNPNQASYCAQCHQSNPGTPGCFNNTLCHGNQD